LDSRIQKEYKEEIKEKTDNEGINRVGLLGIFPPYEPDYYRNAVAELCYSYHGGSGFNFTPRDIETFDVDDIRFYLEWLEKRRGDEAKRIEKAYSKK
jgi:hypothetical protein